MNKEKFSEHIGNIDDRLVKQAEQLPNYAAMHHKKGFRQLLGIAAALVLMVSGFGVGAIAFARETIVEVPVEQETLELEEINLTLILPDSWEGQYSVEKRGENFDVYIPEIREKEAGYEGILFTIVCYEESMTEEQFIENGLDFTAYRYILTTSNKTYILHYASDVQWDPADKEQEAVYLKMMGEIKDIRFSVDNVFENITQNAISNGIVKSDMEADDGKMHIFYTGINYREEDPENINCALNYGFIASQMKIVSQDGYTFDNFNAKTTIINPLRDSTSGSESDTRDPKVWRGSDAWYMIVGSTYDNNGRFLFFKSDNLENWEYVNYCEKRGFGCIWECPDYFEVNGKGVVIFSPIGILDDNMMYDSAAICCFADFDEKSCKMTMSDEYSMSGIIREGKTSQIRSFLMMGRSEGMQTLDLHLAYLLHTRQISMSVAEEYCTDIEVIKYHDQLFED